MQKWAFIFPGQGSQGVGMLSSVAHDPHVQQTFNQASEVLGYDLWQLVQKGPETKLNDTRVTQPAVLTASIALWRIWQDKNQTLPSMVAGHSLGEYSALVAAQALDFTDAVALVAKRGEFMQQAVPEGVGAMAAVLGFTDDEVIQICQQASGNQVLSAVNFNAPGQVVIAGHKEAVERALQLIKIAGKRALVLPVSVPSHCLLMKEAAEKLAQALTAIDLREPQIKLINNVDVLSPQNPQEIKNALVKQLYSPVRWVETIEAMRKECTHFIECGPGRVLTGLNKRINSELSTYHISEADSLMSTL